MPDKPNRSVFVPLLIVGAIVGLFLIATLVPVVGCSPCSVTWPNDNGGTETFYRSGFPCERCGGRSKVPLLDIWRREAEEGP